jgi:hypothetical protein
MENKFTQEDIKLFQKIETDIKNNCTKYIDAGKWLDQFYDVGKFWKEKMELLQTINEICKSHKECECEFCKEAEWLSWVIEKKNFTSQDEYIEISDDTDQKFTEELFKEEVPAIYRLLEAKSGLTSKYISNCGMLSEQDARCIYLTNWLFTSPESRNDTDIEITKFQHYELKELEGIIYSRMGLLFSTQRNIEEWIKMIKTAQHRLDFEKKNKAKPALPKEPAKDKGDLAETGQGATDGGDTYNSIGSHVSLGNKAQHTSGDINVITTDSKRGKGGWELVKKIGLILTIIVALIAIYQFVYKKEDNPAIEQKMNKSHGGIQVTGDLFINKTENPLQKPIVAVNINVEVKIKSDWDFNGRVSNMPAYFGFVKGNTLLLKAFSIGYMASQTGNGEVVYKGNLNTDSKDPSMGNPASFLKDAEYIQIEFGQMQSDSLVLGGDVICTINNSIRIEFSIPPQKLVNNKIYIRNLSESLQVLNEPSN